MSEFKPGDRVVKKVDGIGEARVIGPSQKNPDWVVLESIDGWCHHATSHRNLEHAKTPKQKALDCLTKEMGYSADCQLALFIKAIEEKEQ